MERKNISDILGNNVKIRRAKNKDEAANHGWSLNNHRSCLLICRASDNTVIATIDDASLFDENGNYFNIDD